MRIIIVRRASYKHIKEIAYREMVQLSATAVEKGVGVLLLSLLFYSCYEVYPNTIGIFSMAEEM